MPSGRRTLLPFCLVVAALLALLWPSPRADAAAGPEFLEQDQLSIPLERLATGTWQIVVINPGSAADVEIRVAGSVSDALALKDGGHMHVGPGGTGTVTLVAGKRPHAGTGQLVLISSAGVDRLRVAVTPPAPFLQRYPFVPAVAGVLALAAIAGTVFWRRGRRRRQNTESAGPSPRGPVQRDSRGFTHSDEPAQRDGLRREEYARHLAELARYASPPMVIGVFGEWGTGKTSMLMQVRDRLSEAPECAHVWFAPWRHQYDDNPVLPLLHVIVKDLALERRHNVQRTLRTISDVLGSLVLSTSLKINLSDVRQSIKDYDSEHFRIRSERTRLDEYLGELIDEALAACGKERLVVFVDDLDRCDADRITSLLESLKLHFNRDNCVFLLGVAKGPLIEAVREKYKNPVGDYLDKIIQFPFEMPRLSEEDFARYLDGLLTDEIRTAGDMLKCGLRRNARAIKRFVNVLILQDRVAKDRRLDPYDVSILAAVLLLRDGAPDDYARLMEDPALLRRLAQEADGEPDGWSELAVSIVRELRGMPGGVPNDILAYIDLVRESPVPPSSDLIAGAPPKQEEPASELSRQLELRAVLEDLAVDVRTRVDRLVEDDGRLLEPVVRVQGEERTGMASLHDLLSRETTKLFISGAPGVGKSVVAARLARWLAERRAPQTPVFLPFGVLKTEFREYERWVTHALVAEYRLSAANANAVVVRGSLVLILDGLDALEPNKRAGFLEWARTSRCGVVITGRDAAASGFDVAEVLGVSAVEARRRFEAVLAANKVEPDRLLGLTSELMSSPLLLRVLTDDQAWVEALPKDPVDFLAWYGARGQQAMTAAGFTPDAVTRGLHGIARATGNSRNPTISGDDADIRTRLRHAGIRAVDVPAFLRAAVEAGLLREAAPQAYHFVHPLLRKQLAGAAG
ncbi:P-loop NTPase fold protein [Nonomuraea sp. NBC_00507]|uniref:P-loop NTPase fold protein n=1 Tax=Nonomuraea sp. NBC_00507 TaxID=2976002 RepID=UPI002E197827